MGYIVEIHETSQPLLDFRLVATAPIQCVDVYNGSQVISTKHPYGAAELGNRYKLVWNGARLRGQDRVLRWDGGLTVKGNRILGSVPVNFWNPDHPLIQDGSDALNWESFTTGTAKGVILTLEKPAEGLIHFDTSECKLDIDLQDIRLDPVIWELGDLEKSVRIDRLPENNHSFTYTFQIPLENLHDGDNPIFIRIIQEDGQKAWSSPVYLVK